MNTKHFRRVAARDLAKKLCSTYLQKFKKALLRFSQQYIKTLPGFCCSVAQSCLTPCDPMNFSMPGFPVHHHLLKFPQTHSIGLLMPPNHLILSCLLFLPSIFPRIKGFVLFCFPNELTLPIRRPKYWRFSISFSTEYSGLISLRIDRLDLLAVQGTLKSLLHFPAPQFEKISSSALSLLYDGALPSASNYWEKHSFDFMDICWQSNASFF